MSNRRRLHHDNRHLSPEGRKPSRAYTAAELHQFLVSDAVKMHATYLPWAVAAYTRIGKLERCGAETAYRRVVDEVKALTGHGMPVHSGPIVAS